MTAMRPKSARKVVLVVEDDDHVAELLTSAINDEDGYVALRVPDAERALRAVATVSTDVLVVDIELPGMSGLDLYDRLRAEPRYRSIPVVFETGRAPAYADEMRRRGIAAFVRKPFDLNDVVRFVKSLAPVSRPGARATA